jgi:putative membrane protein
MNHHRRLGAIVAAAALLAAHGAAVQAQAVPAPAQGQALAAVPLNSADLEFMLYAAHVNHATVAAARLALQRSGNAEVQELAQRLIDTHQGAQQRLRRLAEADGVALPRTPSRQHSYVIDGLQGLDGQQFDRSFVRRIAIAEHRDALQRFQAQATAAGRDEQLAAYAEALLPRLRRDLAAAQSLHAQLGAAAPG